MCDGHIFKSKLHRMTALKTAETYSCHQTLLLD